MEPVTKVTPPLNTTLEDVHQRPDRRAEAADDWRRLLRILARLDDDKREMFVLAEFEGLSVPEIATILELKVNTAYSRLRLAREAFEKAFEEEERSPR